jgi:hypothetical protein
MYGVWRARVMLEKVKGEELRRKREMGRGVY